MLRVRAMGFNEVLGRKQLEMHKAVVMMSVTGSAGPIIRYDRVTLVRAIHSVEV